MNIAEGVFMTTIGWIGAGAMGANMATKLIEAGYTVKVYDQIQQKLDPLLNIGALPAKTPFEAAENADMVFSIVTDDKASDEVWLGETGAIRGLKKDTLAVECSTLSLEQCDKLEHEITKQANAAFGTAPVVGNYLNAQKGELIVLLGGDSQFCQNLEPLLAGIATQTIHVGSASQAMALKLVITASISVQLLLHSHLKAFLRQQDMNEDILQRFDNLPFTTGVAGILNEVTASGDTDKQIPLNLVKKDLGNLIANLDDQNSQTKELITAARHIYAQANTMEELLSTR